MRKRSDFKLQSVSIVAMRCTSHQICGMSAPFPAHGAGFFFGVGRNIEPAAHNAQGGRLFHPKHRIIGQEGDLYDRMQQVRTQCLYHAHAADPAFDNLLI